MPHPWPAQLIITTVLQILTFVLILTKTITLLRKRTFHHPEHYILGIAWILTTTQHSLLLTSFHTITSSDSHSPGALHTLFTSSLFYSPTITLLKISATYILLRLQTSLPRRALLYTTILALQILPSTASLIFQLARCRPLAYNWIPDPARALYPNGKCVGGKGVRDGVLWFEGGMGVSMSIVLVVLAGVFWGKMYKDEKKMIDRVGLTLMITLGVFSVSANGVRMALLRGVPAAGGEVTTTTMSRDEFDMKVRVIEWMVLEEQAWILILCIPSLKPLFAKNAHRFSLHSYNTADNDDEPQPSRFNRISSNDASSSSSHPHPQHLHKPPSSKTSPPPNKTKNPRRQRQRKHHPRHPIRTNTTTSPTLPFIPTPALKSTIANINRVTPSPIPLSSAETIWPTPNMYAPPRREDDDDGDEEEGEEEDVEELLRGGGGILMTTEFQIRSEHVSRMPSRDDVLRERDT
ncbi:hypothetical protein DM02DRAFT_669149 [Periconia macrospinosa]|uniref:Rhodopsin domain-containing protein n=1 Tax=Periconia macrospinosa TaxID=97972 RepID=A0A2V1E186_9PLEO|nr:hypothetical protein DM02DRAFT_669149 [Periconia macrospinosa]